MEYIHFSSEPLREVRSVVQDGRAVSQGDKPCGLWFSVEGNDDGWRNFCDSETWGLDRMGYATRLVFSDRAKILQVSGAVGIDALCREYGIIPDWCRGRSYERYGIDWPRIAQEYDAVIIAPYIWSRRLEVGWYYGWDCASGCVWDADAVSRLEPVDLAQAA